MRDPLGDSGRFFECRYLTGADGWKLRVLSWTPRQEEAARRRPILLVPGWTSVVDGWISLLGAWTRVRPVHYVETREKNQARSPQGHRERLEDFTIASHARDLAAVADELGIGDGGNWFASSLGSTSILEGLKNGDLGAASVFLLAPNARFVLPRWAAILSVLPWWIYPPLIRAFAIPYLRWRVREEGQKIRYSRTLRDADMRRLRLSTRANRRYAVWNGLEAVRVPCAICVARSDKLHGHEDALRIAELLPRASLIEVDSNQLAHQAEFVPALERWLRESKAG